MFKFIFIKIYFFFSLILILLLFLIQKIVLIRVGYYNKSKIGHLIGNTQIYLYKQKAKKKFNLKYDTYIQFDIWISWDKTLYPVIENFYKNKIVELRPILLWGIYVLANKYSFFKKFLISEHDWGMDYYNLNYKNRTQKILNKNQIEYAENKLKEISIFPDNKIACFINRNNFFNSKIVKDKSLIEVNEYRNTNFKDYLPAIKYLEDKGYKILRMGSHDKNFKNKYVINYSSSKISNHLLDMFLLKKAELIISSGTGIDNAAAHFFKKPVCYVNLIPYLNIQNFKFSPKGVFITKKLVKKKKLLSLKEIINMNYFSLGDSKSYEDRGIKVLNNSKKEILECVKEFYKINIENYKYKKKELLLQKKFYNILNSELYKVPEYENILGSYKNVDMSLKQKPMANFSLNFLNNNKWFLKV
jgi:putative glycosyltransferase (TIGR04372 family)